MPNCGGDANAAHMPLLRDDYLRNLMNFTSAVVHPWEQPDVTEIVARLQRVTDRALHKTGAKRSRCRNVDARYAVIPPFAEDMATPTNLASECGAGGMPEGATWRRAKNNLSE